MYVIISLLENEWQPGELEAIPGNSSYPESRNSIGCHYLSPETAHVLSSSIILDTTALSGSIIGGIDK